MATWEPMLERLMRERAPRLLAYASLLTGDDAEAADVVQDALVKTFSRGRRFDDIAQAEAYTRKAISTIVIDAARSRGSRRKREEREWAGAQTHGQSSDSALDVRAALTRLSPRERACIVLRFYDDLTVSQIAGRLGLAEGSVKRYLSDASAKLANLLGADVDVSAKETVPVTAPERRGS